MKNNKMKIKYCHVFFIIVTAVVLKINAQNTYYFSSSSGNDLNDGSISNPLQTISKLNSLVLLPGDKILFKRGDTFIGQIVINNSGTDGLPIIFNSYGTGELPILTGSDGNNDITDPISTIRIVGEEYLEFHNLRIENERFDSNNNVGDDAMSFGIYFQSYLNLPLSGNFEDVEPFNSFRFSNLHFENIYAINSTSTAFNQIRTSGIYFFESFVNDLIIEDCYFTKIERVGIWLRKYVADAIIRNNTFIDIGGSGAIFSQCKRVLYENNLMRFCGSTSDPRMAGRGSGMWVFASDDVVAQYNISQHARGNGDSSGMHIDYGNTNILYQYNYSEDSAGGFCEILGDNNNVIWRYNISVNDGTPNRGGKNNLIWVSDYAGMSRSIKSDNVYIYNNTIYQGIDYRNEVSNSNLVLLAERLNFYNNILYLEETAKVGENSYEYNVNTPNFSNNIIYGGTIKTDFKNLDITRIEQAPAFLFTGKRHTAGYKLLSDSPAIGTAFNFNEPIFPLAGTGIFNAITSNTSKDFFDNSVNLLSATNIGAYNGQGITNIPSVVIYEAEDGAINGGAREIDCINASGGKAVNFMDNGERLTFSNINVAKTDDYAVTIYYLNPSMSNLELTVNGTETENITLPESDSFCFESGTSTPFVLIKSLNSGSNTLVFEKGIIDKIEITEINNISLSTELINTPRSEIMYLNKTVLRQDENLKLSFYDKTIKPTTNILIYNLNGGLAYKGKFKTSTISIEGYKIGKGVKIVLALIEGKKSIRRIIVR